ncbi:SDR family oxidoreductase [Deinococcus roseus]|uniref:Retinol dehydrogenase n=1 Tax=Deinococcus roseus TaxID=392414 RepID=A0ABQ2DGN2_9DEIO|nr:SDR family oxidoreductase [Deinococcus roseus]GGJ56916.1 retinol dehydrogenase [Deinococcus roseus]
MSIQPPLKTALVTGGTSGIGRATAEGLARNGFQVILTGRERSRAEETVKQLQQHTRNPHISYLLADLSLTSEVQRLGAEVLNRHNTLDVLINNAGGNFSTRQVTPEGFESTWALNHLAYAGLTFKLLPLLQQGSHKRIVNVASGWYARNLPWFDLQGEKRYNVGLAYVQSKLANILFTYALARRLQGTGITVNAVNPGIVDTGIGRNNTGVVRFLHTVLMKPLKRTPEQGAYPSLHLATAAEVAGLTGQFFDKTQFRRTAAFTYDLALQDRLWQVALEHLGLQEAEMADFLAGNIQPVQKRTGKPATA